MKNYAFWIFFAILVLVACAGENTPAVTVKPPEEDAIEVAVALTIEARSVTEQMDIPEPTLTVEPTIEPIATVKPTVTLEPTSTVEPTPIPTAELTPIPEPTEEQVPAYTCEGEEVEFTEFMKEWDKVSELVDHSIAVTNTALFREQVEKLTELSPPSCMKEWYENTLKTLESSADLADEITNDRGEIITSIETWNLLFESFYETWQGKFVFANILNSAKVNINGDDLPRYDHLYIVRSDGQFTSDNFVIDEACDDMTAEWVAIQSNDGGYTHIELVNYDTGEAQNIANKVLGGRVDLNTRIIKDVEVGTYFVRSETYPKWAVDLYCEREWELQ